MYRKLFRIVLTLASVVITTEALSAQSQPSYFLTGQVLDQHTQQPIEYAVVSIKEYNKNTTTDEQGRFRLTKLEACYCTLEIYHLGFCRHELKVNLQNDTAIIINLHHHEEIIEEVVVEDDKMQVVASESIGEATIAANANKSLAGMLEQMNGISVLRTGQVEKPIIHGLYGNRIAILNNGVELAGQQWGNDHAPEVDPYSANEITVLKGASALAHSGTALGGVVLVSPKSIEPTLPLSGNVNYILQTNGWGHTLNAQVQQGAKFAAWRLTGTFKRSGDLRSPNYWLTNTGQLEGNVTALVEKYIGKWKTSLYYSFFQTKLGILRGLHIGNLTDLEAAIGREVPFFTKDKFSYQIAAPRQEVQHHLAKAEAIFFWDENRLFRIRYAAQFNKRNEFDVRRGGNTNPALSLALQTHTLRAAYEGTLTDELALEAGVQIELKDNTNQPETGVLPLIPDYRAYTTSAFAIIRYQLGQYLQLQGGGRYDFKFLDVWAIEQTPVLQIKKKQHLFHNYAFSAGLAWNPIKSFSTKLDIGYTQRVPEINELYSAGLHQGISGIEQGSADLKNEKALKVVWDNEWQLPKNLELKATAYYQNIQNYIYLRPREELRLTIRGAFPVYDYTQTNAHLFGADLQVSYRPKTGIAASVQYAVVRGIDITNQQPLIYIPSDNLLGTIAYQFKEKGKTSQSFVQVQGRYVFQQNEQISEQDLLEVPAGYFLLGMSGGTTFSIGKYQLRMSVQIENLLNQKYRDYLNRQRYFADDLGINASLRMQLIF